MSTVNTFSGRQKAVITEARDMGYIVTGRREEQWEMDSTGPRSHLASSFRRIERELEDSSPDLGHVNGFQSRCSSKEL